MAEENIMAILESNGSGNGDDQDLETLSTKVGDQQITHVDHSLLRLMKISNEFVMIRDSMEMFPLPGNKVEPHFAMNVGFGPTANAGEFGQGMRATDLLMSFSLSVDITKHKIMELAENALNEVTNMLAEGEPLWKHDQNRGIEVLNNAEYTKRFHSNLETTLEEIIRIIAVDAPLDLPNLDGTMDSNKHTPSSEEGLIKDDDVNQPGPRPSHANQGSREIGYIQMPAICIVEILMDVRLWSFVFSEMLSRAAVLGIISPGAPGTHDGALQVMTAEYHAPSPLLPTQQSCFARYCKELSPNMWLIVDISLESMIDNPLMNCKRRPSGCLIQGSIDGNTTQVTWIEHTEATEHAFIHPLFKSMINTGFLFSAKHWIDTLARQCQHLDIVIHSQSGLFRDSIRVEGLLRLAERMRREFYGAISSTKGNGYKPMSIKGGDDIWVKTSIEGDDQSPILFTVTTSTWFAFTRRRVFGFLGNEGNRIKWDILALGHKSEEVFHVHNGQGPEDIVTITKLVDENGAIDTFFLQEKHQTALASYVILSPITYDSLVALSNHGNIDEIPLLPSGFAILSNKLQSGKEGESAGSLFTLSFQLLDKSSKARDIIPPRSIRKLYNLVTNTISSIRAALFEPPTNVSEDDMEVGCTCVKRREPKETEDGRGNNGIYVEEIM